MKNHSMNTCGTCHLRELYIKVLTSHITRTFTSACVCNKRAFLSLPGWPNLNFIIYFFQIHEFATGIRTKMAENKKISAEETIQVISFFLFPNMSCTRKNQFSANMLNNCVFQSHSTNIYVCICIYAARGKLNLHFPLSIYLSLFLSLIGKARLIGKVACSINKHDSSSCSPWC
jgi:hypothetical protein